MRKIKVALGASSYDITIGYSIEQKLMEFVCTSGFSAKALLVSDELIGSLYGEKVLGILRQAGLEAEMYLVPAGERSKSLEVAEKLYTKAIELRLDRKSAVFALGGGVVGDLTGFVAATYMRGVPFIQLPTSLLAQVDSSVGGKVAVNHRLGKNLIGAFYQPYAVFMDLSMMATLPKREIYTGLGEIIKYGIIYDADFFVYLEENVEKIVALQTDALVHIIARSCEIKAEVVSKDEKETGLRIILNFGHTIAHAIESETGYTKYNHGEAVAIGMLGAAKISEAIGSINHDTVVRVKNLIERFHLPTKAAGCTMEKMFATIFHDKKTVNGKVQWVLMERIGKVSVKTNVPDVIVQKIMAECLSD
ncbi:MAG: 3-dehydroquinate synthase [Selenomonadaceae bacterium]